MKFRTTFFFIFLISLHFLSHSQNVEFTGVGKQNVQVGERFRIVYEINAEGENFRTPDFGGLNVLSGPNSSTSSSVQIINGNMQQSFSISYTFVVEALKEGEVTVSPATISVKGKTYTSNPIKINVSKNSGGGQNSGGNGASGSSSSDGTLHSDDVYIKASVDNLNPFQGEQVIVTYRIYTRVPIANIAMKKSPSFPGFWSVNLQDDNTQLKQTTQIINGEEYIVADISKYALFAQKNGVLTIDPVEIECVAQIRSKSKKSKSKDPFEEFFNDPFFNRDINNIQTTITSKPLTINVKPLPQQGQPTSFTGAVGDFTFTSEVDKTNLTTNDALTLAVSISGNGNLDLINLSKPDFPSDFETYDPKITSNIKTGVNGVSGTKKFDFLAIPRTAGDFSIKPLTFSYFDPKAQEYRTFSSGDLDIKVAKGSQSSTGVSYSSSAQEDIRFIGKDIRHIKNPPYKFHPAGNFLFGSSAYYFYLILPIVLMTAAVIFLKREEKRRSNTGLLKNRKANKVARTRLQKADKFRLENNDKLFYDEIAQALWGYIIDKFGISPANLSVDTVKETLENKNIEENVINNFINTLNNIEFARFAPGNASGKMESIYNEALNAITQSEKALK